MATIDLTDPEVIRQQDEMMRQAGGRIAEVHRESIAFYERIRSAPRSERETVEFQQQLWEDELIAASGMCTVKTDALVQNARLRRFIADLSLRALPPEPGARTPLLTDWFAEFENQVKPLTTRMPWLKMFRMMAALFPSEFTRLADTAKLATLHRAMLGKGEKNEVARHANVLRRIAAVLPPAPDNLEEEAWRAQLTWQLYAALIGEGRDSPTETLVPLPPARRRRGLLSLSGYAQTVMGGLEIAREGASRDELAEFLRGGNRSMKASSVSTLLNVFNELGVLQREGDRFELTERGQALLDRNDKTKLAAWLLTRVLGLDHAVAALRSGPKRVGEVKRVIKAANPGWTSDYMPGAILAWLRSLEVVENTDEGLIRLTDEGKAWAKMITWTPQNLASDPGEIGLMPKPEPTGGQSTAPAVQVPRLEHLHAALGASRMFGEDRLEELHVGLWANRRRHFAVLTGLSGAGKTRLAREYAGALIGHAPGSDGYRDRVCEVPVQPGWLDPTALLGYLHPLQEEPSYVPTPFLDWLLQAGQDTAQPYVAIFDEMNLSHPEQYMAPLLSAMETGGDIVLHTDEDLKASIPMAVPYTDNLVLIGTVNMDETTHGLSDKVLDRAFTIEFWEIDLDAYPWSEMALPSDVVEKARSVMTELMFALSPARLHFGWRTVDDVMGYIMRSREAGTQRTIATILDNVVYAKVLPKLRGEDSDLFRTSIERCREVLAKHDLRRSANKAGELLNDVRTTGSARFWR